MVYLQPLRSTEHMQPKCRHDCSYMLRERQSLRGPEYQGDAQNAFYNDDNDVLFSTESALMVDGVQRS